MNVNQAQIFFRITVLNIFILVTTKKRATRTFVIFGMKKMLKKRALMIFIILSVPNYNSSNSRGVFRNTESTQGLSCPVHIYLVIESRSNFL